MNKTRWLSIALFVSVALNLALAGALAAQAWRMREGMRMEGRGPEGLARQLSPTGAEKARTLMRSRRPEAMELFTAIREARGDAQAALIAKPFDAARLARAMDQLRVANKSLQKHIQVGFIDLAGQVSHDDREKLSRLMPGMGPPRDRERDRHPRGDGPPPPMR